MEYARAAAAEQEAASKADRHKRATRTALLRRQVAACRSLKYGYSVDAQPDGDQGAAFGVARQMRLGASAMPGCYEHRVALACIGPTDTIERQQHRLEIGEIKRPGNPRLEKRHFSI